MNLLTKLKDSIKNNKTKLAAVALASGVAVSAGLGCMASCDKNNLIPGTSITKPNNQQSKYSSILQGVMTKDFYKTSLTWGNLSETPERNVNNHRFLPIPYGFLEKEGYDIENVKWGTYDAFAEVFRIEHDLYVACGVETEASTNYITNYLLKYKVTDQEIKEMNKLFKSINVNDYNYTYFQAPFYIQELSYQKTPEIINISYQSKVTQKNAQLGLKGKKLPGNIAILNYWSADPPYEDRYYNSIIWPKSNVTAHLENVEISYRTLYSIYSDSYNPILHIDNKEVLNLNAISNSSASKNLGEARKSPYLNNEPNSKAFGDVYSSSDRYFKDITLYDYWEDTFYEENPFVIN